MQNLRRAEATPRASRHLPRLLPIRKSDRTNDIAICRQRLNGPGTDESSARKPGQPKSYRVKARLYGVRRKKPTQVRGWPVERTLRWASAATLNKRRWARGYCAYGRNCRQAKCCERCFCHDKVATQRSRRKSLPNAKNGKKSGGCISTIAASPRGPAGAGTGRRRKCWRGKLLRCTDGNHRLT